MTAHPIPDAALGECVAVVGRTGAGKSFTARGLCERVLDRGERLCVIDPTGVWWGLRLARDGAAPGYPVAVFGGDYADVQIGERSGAPVAELVAGRNLPAVIDLSGFTIGARTRFLTAFLETLYAKNRRDPLTLVVDEADIVAPQRLQPEQTVMFSRLEQIVRRGRVRGFRPWLLTQRPAELHKSVLSQAATLIALKLTAPQDRKAVEGWVMGHADRAKGRAVLDTLAGLARGEGWVWCPGHDILERVRFPAIATYDSMRTPESGEHHPAPSSLAEVDLSALRDSLAAVVAEAAANDPAALKKRIAELQRALDLAQRQPAPVSLDPKAIADAERRGAQRATASIADTLAQTVLPALAGLKDTAARVEALTASFETFLSSLAAAPATDAPSIPERDGNYARSHAAPADRAGGTHGDGPGQTMPRAERRILTALAQYPHGRTRTQVAVLTGYAVTGGGFQNALGALRTRGWIEGRDALQATAAGIAALGRFEPLPHGDALLQHWRAQLGKAERSILDVLAERHPGTMARDELAARTGYAPDGGGFNNAIGRLRTLELISGDRSALRASDDLFG